MRFYRIARSFFILAAVAGLLASQGNSFAQGTAQSSAEGINPFNEFMSPSGGVNLFSGDVAYTHPLYTVRGKNGLDLPLEMQYSSNVRLNVSARNDKAPTDWVGLGWRFGFGFIKCDANRTVTLDDDQCFYVSPKGVSQQILPNGTGFVLEKEPFWKVERSLSTDGNRVLGWTLTDVMGRKFAYGDFKEPAVLRNATRYVLAWTGAAHNNMDVVGTGFAGTPSLYPVQWDLASETDVAGNPIQFTYDQKTELLKKGNWNSVEAYTKASYLSTIVLPGRETVAFFRNPKTKNEIYDPWDFQAEPDPFLDPLEEDDLDRVEIRNGAGMKIREFRMGYDVHSFVDKPGYAKRFLTAIREYGTDGFVGSYRFKYAVDRPDKVDYPLGMMTEMETPLCTKVQFDYAKVGLDQSNINRISKPKSSQNFTDDFIPSVGKLPNGKEFLVVNNSGNKGFPDAAHQRFNVFNNEDGIWKPKKVKPMVGDTPLPDNLLLTSGGFIQVIAGEGFFIIAKNTDPGCRVSIFEWDGKDWRATNIYDKPTTSDMPLAGNASGRMAVLYTLVPPFETKAEINLLNDPFMVQYANALLSKFSKNSSDIYVYSYRKDAGVWKETLVKQTYGYSFPSSRLVGNQFLLSLMDVDLTTIGNDKRYQIYTWNGKTWTNTFGKDGFDRDDQWALGDGFLAAAQENSGFSGPDHFNRTYTWNGFGWESGPKLPLDNAFSSPTIEGIGAGYFATKYDEDAELKVLQWTGEEWEISAHRDMLNGESIFDQALPPSDLAWNGRAYDGNFAALYPHFDWHYITIYYPVFRHWRVHWKSVNIPSYQSYVVDAKMRMFQRDGNTWINNDLGSFGYPHTPKDPKVGQDFFAHNTNPSNAQIWDGTAWNPQDFGNPLSQGSLFVLTGDLLGEKNGTTLSLYRKVQNTLASALTAFVVSKKTVEDPVRGQTSVFSYTFDTKGALYDPQSGAAKFHSVALDLPGHGRKSYRFHNGYITPDDGLSQAESDASYELSGNLFLEEESAISGKLVSRQRYTYEVYRQAGWPSMVKSIRLTQTESLLDKVKTSINRSYNNDNGLPEKTEETASGRTRITQITWAHNILPTYADMGAAGKHMLGQVAEQRVYEGDETDANLQQSRVTTWAAWPDAGSSWHPAQSWTWNGRKGVSAFQAFKFDPNSTNISPWKLLSSVESRDASGRAVQAATPKGIATCDLYGHGGNYLIASVQNARCGEVAILPGDYDDNYSGKLDITQRWVKNDAALFTATTHFGSACLHIPAGTLGPAKSLAGAAAGRDYVFSAWVYPITVSASDPLALKVFDAAGAEIMPSEATFGNVNPGTTGGWQLIKRTIPASFLVGGNPSIQVRGVGSADFYVDDIRFYPVDAMVNTRYLDSRFPLPVAEVAPSGSGAYSEYDGKARVVHTYSEDGHGHKIKRSDVDYHLGGCGYLSEASGTLAMLKASAGFIPFNKTEHEYGDLWVEPTYEKVLLQFAPENPYEDVTIRINGGQWELPCCRGSDSYEVTLGADSTEVEVKAGEGQPYHVTLRRPTDCWALQGSQVSPGRGHLPAAATDGSDTWVAYKNDEDGGKLYVKSWNASNQTWVQMGGAISVGEVSDPILRFVSGTRYIAFLDQITVGTGDDARKEGRAVVKRWDGSGWMPLEGDGTVSKGETRGLSFEPSGTALWLAFSGDRVAEEGGTVQEHPVYVRKWDGTHWVAVGDFVSIPDHPQPDIDYHGDGIEDGRVSDGDAESPSLAIHPDGTAHIAYIGHVKIQADVNGETQASAKAFIVKKLISENGTNYWGDLAPSVDINGADLGLTSSGEVLVQPGASRIQIIFGGNTLYAAFAYTYLAPSADQSGFLEESNTRVLDVRRFDGSATFSDDSHWFPLSSGTTPEEYAMASLDEAADFTLAMRAVQPAVAFVNANNHDRLTVVAYDGTTWRSVGNPAFLPVDKAERNGALALAAGSTGLFTSFTQEGEEGDNRDQAVSVAAYSGTCPDLTLNQLEVLDNGTALKMNWSFRSYILYLDGAIREDAVSAGIRIAPAALGSLSKVWVIPSSGPAQNRDLAAGETLPDAFTVGLAPGENTVDVELVSADGRHRNRYHIVLHRLPPTAPTGTIVLETPSSPAFDPAKPGAYQVVVPADKSSFTISIDISDVKDVFVNGQPVEGKTSVEVSLEPGTNVITIVIVTATGEHRQFDISVIRGAASLAVRPILESVSFIKSGQYQAVFGYENLNAQTVDLPVGNFNGIRYQGNSGQYLGQPVHFDPGLVHQAFTVDFDGTPLVWYLDGGSVTAVGDTAKPKMRVEMKDNGLAESDISKPQLRLTNQSSSALSGFKVSLWLSRQEVPWQEILADAYYFNPSGIQMSVSSHPDNENLIRVDLLYPSGFSLAPGASTDDAGLQIGLHFRNYYPGQWIRDNDWSWQGIGSVYRQTDYVTVYDSDGHLLAGQEPSPASVPQPPPLNKANVFSFDAVWPWQTSLGALRSNMTHRTEGAAALEVDGTGYIEVSHLPMKTTDISGADVHVLVDFYLPSGQSNPWWKGTVQLVADCPSAGLYSAYIGQTDLTSLPDGQFSTLSFTLPANVLNTLQGNWRDFNFKWVLNVNQAAEYPVLDNMRFAP